MKKLFVLTLIALFFACAPEGSVEPNETTVNVTENIDKEDPNGNRMLGDPIDIKFHHNGFSYEGPNSAPIIFFLDLEDLLGHDDATHIQDLEVSIFDHRGRKIASCRPPSNGDPDNPGNILVVPDNNIITSTLSDFSGRTTSWIPRGNSGQVYTANISFHYSTDGGTTYSPKNINDVPLEFERISGEHIKIVK